MLRDDDEQRYFTFVLKIDLPDEFVRLVKKYGFGILYATTSDSYECEIVSAYIDDPKQSSITVHNIDERIDYIAEDDNGTFLDGDEIDSQLFTSITASALSFISIKAVDETRFERRHMKICGCGCDSDNDGASDSYSVLYPRDSVRFE